VESDQGPARKYYRLTNQGHQHYRELKKGWIEFVEKVSQLMKEDHDDKE
jgi:PadR family transcriptional regulator PadR